MRPFLLTLLMLVVAACSGLTTDESTNTPSPVSGGAAFLAEDPPAEWTGGSIGVSELPAEAHETLALIEDDGPYPYRQDGGTFQNREGLLPDRAAGHYREFTVETPGSEDRGARRFVVGDDAEAYYTEDHYRSFRFVRP